MVYKIIDNVREYTYNINTKEMDDMEPMTNVNIRMSVEDKEIATSILESMGLNMSTLINMTVKQLIQKRKVPFEITAPSDDAYLLKYFTKEELEEGSKELELMESNPESYRSYETLDDLYKSLNED